VENGVDPTTISTNNYPTNILLEFSCKLFNKTTLLTLLEFFELFFTLYLNDSYAQISGRQ